MMLAQWDQPVAYCPAHPPELVISLATLSPLVSPSHSSHSTLLSASYLLVTSQTLNLMLFYDKFHLISHFLRKKKIH